MSASTAVRLTFGITLLLKPGLLVGAAGARADRRAMPVARLLGARHIVQALLIGSRPGRSWRYAGAAIDGVHAASMLLLATRDERDRRLCLLNALTALTLSAASLKAAQSSRNA